MLGLTTLAAPFAPLSSAFGDTKYPTQPIRLIVPRPAGGVVDVVGRVWGNQAGAVARRLDRGRQYRRRWRHHRHRAGRTCQPPTVTRC